MTVMSLRAKSFLQLGHVALRPPLVALVPEESSHASMHARPNRWPQRRVTRRCRPPFVHGSMQIMQLLSAASVDAFRSARA